MEGTATFVKDLTGFRGSAKLFRLDPPIEQQLFVWDSIGKTTSHEYVVVSAVSVEGEAETYIFGANKDGDVTNWSEMKGSFKGALDHERALSNAGYDTIVYEKV